MPSPPGRNALLDKSNLISRLYRRSSMFDHMPRLRKASCVASLGDRPRYHCMEEDCDRDPPSRRCQLPTGCWTPPPRQLRRPHLCLTLAATALATAPGCPAGACSRRSPGRPAGRRRMAPQRTNASPWRSPIRWTNTPEKARRWRSTTQYEPLVLAPHHAARAPGAAPPEYSTLLHRICPCYERVHLSA